MNENKLKEQRPILFIDGLNIFLRHYLVNGSVNNKSEPVGGVVGFIKFLDYITFIHAPQKIYIVWETGGGNKKRRSIYKEYKQDRGKIKQFQKLQSGTATMKDQLAVDEDCKIKQLSLLYNIIKTTPICQLFVSGTECDDIIAYLVTQKFRNTNAQKIIVSSDKDFYQLLESDSVKMFDPGKKSYVDGNDVFKAYNIAPRNFCLARALVGDKSDNINGVPGVGLKTSAKRFPILSDRTKDIMIQDIIEECDKQIANKAKQKIFKEVKNCESIVRRNWKLMYLDSSILSAKDVAKIEYTLDNHKAQMNKMDLIKTILSSGISMAFDFDQFASKLRNAMTYTDGE